MTDIIKAVAEAIAKACSKCNQAINDNTASIAAEFAIEAMQSIENEPMVLELCGMNIEEISRMKYWWNANNPKPFNEFWEEAFGAGVYQATKAMQIREMTVEELRNNITKDATCCGCKHDTDRIMGALAKLGTIRIVGEV